MRIPSCLWKAADLANCRHGGNLVLADAADYGLGELLGGSGRYDLRPKNGQARWSAPAFSRFRQPLVLQIQPKADEKGRISVTFGHPLRHVWDMVENPRGALLFTLPLEIRLTITIIIA